MIRQQTLEKLTEYLHALDDEALETITPSPKPSTAWQQAL